MPPATAAMRRGHPSGCCFDTAQHRGPAPAFRISFDQLKLHIPWILAHRLLPDPRPQALFRAAVLSDSKRGGDMSMEAQISLAHQDLDAFGHGEPPVQAPMTLTDR